MRPRDNSCISETQHTPCENGVGRTQLMFVGRFLIAFTDNFLLFPYPFFK